MSPYSTWRRCSTCDGHGTHGRKSKACRDCGGSGWEHR